MLKLVGPLGKYLKMKFQTALKIDLSDAVADQLRRAILDGEISPGESLPSERELSLSFGVNRATVREALTELEHQGLIARRQGARCRVLDFRASGSVELLRDLMDGGGAMAADARRSFFEVLGMLYGGAAERAAERATDENRKALLATIAALEEAETARDAEACVRLQREFVQRVVDASGEIALQLMSNAVLRGAEAREEETREGVARAGRLLAVAPHAMSTVHRQIATAIARGDGATARETITRMLRFAGAAASAEAGA